MSDTVVRRYILPLLPIAIGLFLIIALLAWNLGYTVASGETSDNLGYYPYGYKIEHYYIRSSFRLKFWTSMGMVFKYDSGQMTVEEVKEQRWVNNDAAVYLNLRIKQHDSSVSTDSARVIYDFQRGQMYVTSRFKLWRTFDKNHERANWMSEAEFDAVLARLQQ